MATLESSTQVAEESSHVSYLLDQEEYTIEFGEDTTFQTIKDGFKNATYTEVEFNCCPHIPVDAICEVIPSMDSNLKSLIIKDTSWLNDECIELFTAYCHKLYKIELQGCLTNITRTGIESIGRNCGSILSLSIISTDEYIGTNEEAENDSTASIQSWDLDNRIFPALINNLTSKLRHFALSGFNNLTIDGLEKFLMYFRRTLQSLDFSELSMINDPVLKTIGDNCHNLFVLKLNHCKKITDQGIECLFSKKCNIELLELNGCENITDNCFEVLAKACPKLAIIKADWCYKVTEVSLQHLAKHCKKLSYISMQSTGLRALPFKLGRLSFLHYLNVNNCVSLTFPSKSVIDGGLAEIKSTLLDYDIENRYRVCALGGAQSGKTSILLSLQADYNVADGATFGVPVTVWYPFLDNTELSMVPERMQEIFPSLSLELWDASGRKALEGIHAYFMCKQCVYIVSFNAAVYNNAEKVPKWINTIQGKHPGSSIIIVASHCDLASEEKVKIQCERVLSKVLEEEENQIREIKEELLFLRDLGLFSMIGMKKRKLEWILEHRPQIHPEIIRISSITGEGVDGLRSLIISIVANSMMTNNLWRSEMEQLYHEIMLRKKNYNLFMRWDEFVRSMETYHVVDKYVVYDMLQYLNDMGCIMIMNRPSQTPSLTKQQNGERELPPDDALYCINPPLLAEAIATLHRNEKNVQDLVIRMQREGHVDSLWSASKPNDWTLRNTFLHITDNGMIRESIIPLLLNRLKIPVEQLATFVIEMKKYYILIEGAPNANYDVELILPNMKNFSVFKRFFMPLQGLLPVIPQVNAWLPKCPPTHIQVGWDYRFVSAVPPSLFLYIISSCTVVKKEAETISYWQSGAYIRNGSVDVSVCQWKDKLVLQVLARSLISNGTRQAVNKAWTILTKYLYTIENILSKYPGLYYEVLALSNTHCKPVLEVVDEYEAGDITENEALLDIPLRGCTRNTTRGCSIPPNYSHWLRSISDQCKVYITHASTINKEINSITGYLKTAGYEVTTDAQNEQGIVDARLVICLLTSSYFEEACLLSVKNNIKDKKILLAIFEKDLSLENQGHSDILLNKVKVDVSGGTGQGASYQPDTGQLKQLVELCNTLIYGSGSLGQDVKRGSVATSPGGGNARNSPQPLKKPFEQFSDIVKKYSNMSNEAEIKHVAATAVAAAVAAATAEHIAKQSNPTMGAKAAARAAEVAAAVAKGDPELASKAVIATAKAVDEVIAFSNNRQSTAVRPLNNNSSTTTIGETNRKNERVKSSMCVII